MELHQHYLSSSSYSHHHPWDLASQKKKEKKSGHLQGRVGEGGESWKGGGGGGGGGGNGSNFSVSKIVLVKHLY